MSNFFAQPDALAYGKTEEQCRTEGIAVLKKLWRRAAAPVARLSNSIDATSTVASM